MNLKPEGNSWRLCLIGGCAFEDGLCFNCGAEEHDLTTARE